MRPMGLSRSYLFAPGDSVRLLEKVFTAGADAVVLDLEDAVLESRKAEARGAAGAALRQRNPDRSLPVYVRINRVFGPHWMEDLQAVFTAAVSGVRLPKAESESQIAAVDEWLTKAEQAAGLEGGSVVIVPTIESVAGLLAARSMGACARVQNLCFGNTDFARDIGADPGPAGLELLYAHSQMVVTSRAAGLSPPVAPVYTNISDADGLRASSDAMRRLGFLGRSCIHPAQLPIVHEVFTPSAQDVARARAIVRAHEAGAREQVGSVAMADGQFVDEAVVLRARQVLNLAERLASAQPAEAR